MSVQVRAHQVNSQLQAPQRVHRAWPGSLTAMQIPRPRAWLALSERTPARKRHRTPRAHPVPVTGKFLQLAPRRWTRAAMCSTLVVAHCLAVVVPEKLLFDALSM